MEKAKSDWNQTIITNTVGLTHIAIKTFKILPFYMLFYHTVEMAYHSVLLVLASVYFPSPQPRQTREITLFSACFKVGSLSVNNVSSNMLFYNHKLVLIVTFLAGLVGNEWTAINVNELLKTYHYAIENKKRIFEVFILQGYQNKLPINLKPTLRIFDEGQLGERPLTKDTLYTISN